MPPGVFREERSGVARSRARPPLSVGSRTSPYGLPRPSAPEALAPHWALAPPALVAYQKPRRYFVCFSSCFPSLHPLLAAANNEALPRRGSPPVRLQLLGSTAHGGLCFWRPAQDLPQLGIGIALCPEQEHDVAGRASLARHCCTCLPVVVFVAVSVVPWFITASFSAPVSSPMLFHPTTCPWTITVTCGPLAPPGAATDPNCASLAKLAGSSAPRS